MTINRLFDLTGKTALVTGGTRGIGLMIAQGLLEAGAKVYITSRKAQACEQARDELSQYGECVSFPSDLSDLDQIKSFSETLSEHESSLDILVNNAGAVWGEALADFPEIGWDKVMDLNVKSLFFLSRELLPLLRAAGSADHPARILNIGSVDGLQVPAVENYSYSASKAAVHHLTRVLAKKLVSDRINVNAIAPGPFESKMTAFMLRDEQNRNMVAGTIPQGRIGLPDDMIGAAVYLCSAASNYVTGTVLPVDGGYAALK